MADVTIINGYNIKDATARNIANSKYDKPSGGIPKSDLSSDVQASLIKADSALQASDLPSVPQFSVDGKKLIITI